MKYAQVMDFYLEFKILYSCQRNQINKVNQMMEIIFENMLNIYTKKLIIRSTTLT